MQCLVRCFICVVDIFQHGMVGLAPLMVCKKWAGLQHDKVKFWASLVVRADAGASVGQTLVQHGHQGHGFLDAKGDMATARHAHS